jgi:hypothetical protein
MEMVHLGDGRETEGESHHVIAAGIARPTPIKDSIVSRRAKVKTPVGGGILDERVCPGIIPSEVVPERRATLSSLTRKAGDCQP